MDCFNRHLAVHARLGATIASAPKATAKATHGKSSVEGYRSDHGIPNHQAITDAVKQTKSLNSLIAARSFRLSCPALIFVAVLESSAAVYALSLFFPPVIPLSSLTGLVAYEAYYSSRAAP